LTMNLHTARGERPLGFLGCVVADTTGMASLGMPLGGITLGALPTNGAPP